MDDLVNQSVFELADIEGGVYVWRNSLLQETVYDLVLYSQRRRLHSAICLWYERTYRGDAMTQHSPYEISRSNLLFQLSLSVSALFSFYLYLFPFLSLSLPDPIWSLPPPSV